MKPMENPVAQSALSGHGVLKFRGPSTAREAVAVDTPSDIQRVLSRVRDLLLADETRSADACIASILRDAQFAAAWNNTNAIIWATTSREELLSPCIPESLRRVIAGYKDELQAVASAWADVVRGLEGHPPVREQVAAIESGRMLLPSYLDDDGLPIEVWEALRSRDAAAVSYIALVDGADRGTKAQLLAEYAERHCHHQRRWLDFLSWMFGLPCPAIVAPDDRKNWEHIFAESADAERGAGALFSHAAAHHPDGFRVGDI
jgi:hypothetical protein